MTGSDSGGISFRRNGRLRSPSLATIGALAGRWGIALVLLGLMLLATLLSPSFLSTGNLLNIVRSVAFVGIAAAGLTYVLLVGGLMDLTIPSVMALAAIVCLWSQPTIGTPAAVALGIACGAGVGSVNGVIVAYFRANPVIVTLGMSIVIGGLASSIVLGNQIYNYDKGIGDFVEASVFSIPTVVFILLAFVGAGELLLRRTTFGRWVIATGANAAASRASGLRVQRTQIAAFAISGATAAVAGILLAFTVGYARISMGAGYEFDALTAVVVGGTSLFGGSGSVSRTLVGVLIVGVVSNVLVLMSVQTVSQGMVKGAIIVAAVSIDMRTRRQVR